jgi:hypothetical protein
MVCEDFTIYKRTYKDFGYICLRKEDNYKSIWLSLSGVNIEKPVNFIKANGDRLLNKNFFEHIIENIGHESLHVVIIKLENLDTSKNYDKLYHYKGSWWLP